MIPVERIWPGSTVAILAGGPSLSARQAELVAAAGVRTIAVKDAVRILPTADLLYGCDLKWWDHHGRVLAGYGGLRFSLDPKAQRSWGTSTLRNTGMTGLETDPSGVRTGKNSGYQAINLAVHLGAARIVLLGFDMRQDPAGRHHWFGGHPYRTVDPPYAEFLKCFPSIVGPLAAAGVEVLNATPGSALDVFPRADLADALAGVAA